MQKNDEVSSYKGYSLYNDVEDHGIKSSNRGAILANILEEHIQNNKVSNRGLALILGYFNSLLPIDRRSVKEAFEGHLIKRGISYGNQAI